MVDEALPTQRGGILVLAGTPLGNPQDASPALSRALREADVIAAEDTRRLHRLASVLGLELSARIISLYDAVEEQRSAYLIDQVARGAMVVVVTDAGMPTISDPGFRLVTAAHAAGLRVTATPGPSAVTTALALSGLPVDRFCFEGFLPRRAGERATRLASLAREERTMVFFEAPHRTAAALAALAEAFGPQREAVVCRELTKTYEEVRRAPLADLVRWAQEGVRGEVTLVVAGAAPQVAGTADDWAAEVALRVSAGADRKEAIAEVARAVGVPKREVYDAVVAAGRVIPPA